MSESGWASSKASRRGGHTYDSNHERRLLRQLRLTGGPQGTRRVRVHQNKSDWTIMLEPQPAVPHQISSRQALFRIVFRFVLLVVFARLVGQDFGTALAALLMMSAIFSWP
jgi:hypothetical protein